MHEGTAQDTGTGVVITWDGVEYELPLNMTPREDGRIHAITGCWGIDILQNQLPLRSAMGVAGLLIIAMERVQGKVDADAILDDPDFNTKIGMRVPDEEVPGDDPPVVAAAEAAAPEVTPPTSETPAASGSPSS